MVLGYPFQTHPNLIGLEFDCALISNQGVFAIVTLENSQTLWVLLLYPVDLGKHTVGLHCPCLFPHVQMILQFYPIKIAIHKGYIGYNGISSMVILSLHHYGYFILYPIYYNIYVWFLHVFTIRSMVTTYQRRLHRILGIPPWTHHCPTPGLLLAKASTKFCAKTGGF
jgi:hypothetical protein